MRPSDTRRALDQLCVWVAHGTGIANVGWSHIGCAGQSFTNSAAAALDAPALFAGFIATMAESDLSRSCIIGFGSSPSRCGPAQHTNLALLADREISRFPYKKATFAARSFLAARWPRRGWAPMGRISAIRPRSRLRPFARALPYPRRPPRRHLGLAPAAPAKGLSSGTKPFAKAAHFAEPNAVETDCPEWAPAEQSAFHRRSGP
jgi:hypothetical protein